ncbi:MAG: hypothetical protein AB7N80_14680 [Bdellovibrionales bacterium]
MRFLFTLFILLTTTAQAEYRAYELNIRNPETGSERRAISTLDHLQYSSYYPIKTGEVVEYVTSWRCYGRTGSFRKTCPNPKAEGMAAPTANSAPDRQPAGTP